MKCGLPPAVALRPRGIIARDVLLRPVWMRSALERRSGSVDERQEVGRMQPEDDRSTRVAPSTADVASTAHEDGARRGVDDEDAAEERDEERRPLLADEEL